MTLNKKAGWQKYLRLLGKNKGLKILSLALALALWFAIGGEERTVTSLKMTLELTNIPKNLIVTNNIPAQIEVRVQGPRSVVRKLTAEQLQKQLDLSGYKVGDHVFPLNPASFDFPRGVIVTRINPNAITVILGRAITRRLEVQPVIKGKPAPGYKLVKVSLSPAQVYIRGPKSELSQLKTLKTQPLDITHLSTTVGREVDLDFQNLHLTYVGDQPILAHLEISPIKKTRVINRVKVVPSNASGPVRLYPSQVSLTIRGPAPQLKDLKPKALTARVDLQNLKPGRHRLQVSANLPPGLELLHIHPPTVRVQLGKARKSK